MTAGTVLGACVLDMLVGDPRWLPHPVRWIGLVIAWVDRRVIRSGAHRPLTMKLAGAAVAIGLPVCVYLVVLGAIRAAELMQAGPIVEMLCAYLALAARDLAVHAMAVRNALRVGDLIQARAAVAQIVGRDTEDLSEQDIMRASVESLAESTCDGIVAPLFFLAIGGAPLAWCYKTVNTLDSVVGHIELPYRDLGWASARLDDAMNWIPARLTAWLIIVSGSIRFLSLSRLRDGWTTLMRDGGKHPSPNSGRSEAAMAGALGVQLGGINRYGGIATSAPLLGQPREPLVPRRLEEAVTLMWMVFALAAGLAALLVW